MVALLGQPTAIAQVQALFISHLVSYTTFLFGSPTFHLSLFQSNLHHLLIKLFKLSSDCTIELHRTIPRPTLYCTEVWTP